MSKTDWFTHDRFGMFIHWGLYSIPCRGEWVKTHEKLSEEAYRPYFEEFNPTRYDPAEWARLARAAGMTYAVLTTKHHDGFCLFDSQLTDYKSTNTPAQRDLVRQYVEAFRAQGLKVGLYYSLLDWHHPHYTVDFHHPLRELPEEHPSRKDRSLPRYIDYLHGQVRELLTNYGKIDLLWFDYSFGDKRGKAWRADDMHRMVRQLQPDILMNDRLTYLDDPAIFAEPVGEITTPEQHIPDEVLRDKQGNPKTWEACITLNDHWGYHRDDHNFKTPAEVVRMLVDCVSKGGNLLLNVGPTPLGQVQPEGIEILRSVGAWMDMFADSLRGAGRPDASLGLAKPEWGRYTQKGSILYAHIFERPMGPLMLHGMKGKVKKARYLQDGTELQLTQPWNVPADSTDLYVNLPQTPLQNPMDTVVAFHLA
jgi:alpha-L-fucosidase